MEVFGDTLKTEELVEEAQRHNYANGKLASELAYELKFLLLDLLALYDDVHYSTWNLIALFMPDDLSATRLEQFFKPAVQPPPTSSGL